MKTKEPQDLEDAIREEEKDKNAPQEWINKMFPELHVKN